MARMFFMMESTRIMVMRLAVAKRRTKAHSSEKEVYVKET